MERTDFFDQMAQAAKALQELPEAQAKLSDLQHGLDVANERLNAKDSEIGRLNQLLEAVQTQLKQTQEDRDNASFRELEASDKLETLLKAIQAASPLREPKIEPVPEVKPVETNTSAGQTLRDLNQPESSETTRPEPSHHETAEEAAAKQPSEVTQPQANPHVESPEGQSMSANTTHAEEPKPASLKPSYLKEPWMTWQAWKDSGGAVPSWADLSST